MINVIKHGVILKKTKLGFENGGVLNPGVISYDGLGHILYRAVRKGNFSSIGYATLSATNKVKERLPYPVILPDNEYEKHGVEDPRIVKIDDVFFITYTAYDGTNANGALATSMDLKTFTKHGIITPQFSYKDFEFHIACSKGLNEKYLRFYKLFKERIGNDTLEKFTVWDKDVIFFPRKINDKFAFLHRLYPSIQIVYFDKLEDLTKDFWREYLFNLNDHIILDTKHDFESSYLGGGCPPIETPHGWLIIYHGVEDTHTGYVYHAGAALMDLNDPTKEIGRLSEPLFSPEYDWEREGYVNNVVFPTGTILSGDDLNIYYGAADTSIAVVTVKLSELLNELKSK
jgi:predicted GH43/DUF377 family glycosyl hydrolase